jgi:DnaB-like helicase N terminal domain/AAA domain
MRPTWSGEKPRKGSGDVTDIHRTPPHSVEAEQGVLGSIFQSAGQVIAECVTKIGPEFFYVPQNRTIYIELLDTWNGGKKIDLIDFTQRLRDKNILESVGGAAFVTSLFSFVPTAANVEYYLDIVRDKYILREIISAATDSVRRAYEPGADDEGGPLKILGEAQCKFASIESLGKNGAAAPDISLVDLAAMKSEMFERDNVLGNRLLCCGGMMLFIGPTGCGKSTAGNQQDFCWTLGREAFGIRPARPLKILYIQAENDQGDLSEMARGIIKHLDLKKSEIEQVRNNLLSYDQRALLEAKFLNWLRRLIEQHRPDLVRIDPLEAYVSNVNDPAVIGPFLRAGLNPILKDFSCAAILNHHTPKTIYRDTKEWTTTDWIYSGAGPAVIYNCARATLAIDATKATGIFSFHAGKRHSRIGWADEQGNPQIERIYCWERDSLFWRLPTDEDLLRIQVEDRKQKGGKTVEELVPLVPLQGSIPKLELQARSHQAGFSRDCFRELLTLAVKDEKLFLWRLPRPKTNPEIHVARHPEPLL